MTDNTPPDARRFVYRDGSLVAVPQVAVPQAPDDRQRLEVADSWLVDSGRVRAIDLHRQRFLRSAAAAGFDDEALLGDFWAAALGAIPPMHRWFPRVELSRGGGGGGAGAGGSGSAGRVAAGGGGGSGGDGGAERWQLSLLMRLAPPPSTSAVLCTLDGPDPRSIPNRKGPDLLALTALRDTARADGVDDVVLLDADGHVVDGATTALLWWRGSELRMPPPRFTRVDSVTARSVLVLAAALGVPATPECARPADLDGAEVWAVNALHGIRVVSAWHDGPQVAAEPGRAALWQRRLEALARPLAS